MRTTLFIRSPLKCAGQPSYASADITWKEGNADADIIKRTSEENAIEADAVRTTNGLSITAINIRARSPCIDMAVRGRPAAACVVAVS